jgi:hypothetical protein
MILEADLYVTIGTTDDGGDPDNRRSDRLHVRELREK